MKESIKETLELPSALASAVPESDLPALRHWWARLPALQQTELRRLWDPRADDIAWTERSSEDWEPLPIRLQGRTVEDPELGPDTRLAKQQLLDFILNHEEIVFFLEERSFHICRWHTQARDVLAAGLLPAGFRCTLRGDACPMRVISKAADERPVRIRLRA